MAAGRGDDVCLPFVLWVARDEASRLAKGSDAGALDVRGGVVARVASTGAVCAIADWQETAMISQFASNPIRNGTPYCLIHLEKYEP
jgi:hypothetical protein